LSHQCNPPRLHYPSSLRGSIEGILNVYSARHCCIPEAISLHLITDESLSKALLESLCQELSARRLIRRKFNANDIPTPSRRFSPLLAMTSEREFSRTQRSKERDFGITRAAFWKPIFFIALFLLFTCSFVFGQTSYVLVPAGLVRETPETISIRIPKGGELSFVIGFGWSPNISNSQPVFAGDDVYVAVDVAEYLGLATNNAVVLSNPSLVPPSSRTPPLSTTQTGATPQETRVTPDTSLPTSSEVMPLPESPPTEPPPVIEDRTGPARITSIRFGGTGSIRVVFDLAGTVDRTALGRSTRQGRLEEGQRLELSLPPLQLPVGDIEPYQNVEVTARTTTTETRVSVIGPGAMSYRAYVLESPLRYVIDLVPLTFANVTPVTREVRPGVVYKHFAFPSSAGSTGVHVLEIAPNTGEFRVVGNSGRAAPMTTLASGALAGINAGYFDTQTFAAIGLLKVDYGLLSFPSRNRASIAFGGGQPVIGRVSAQLHVRINGRLYFSQASSEMNGNLAVHTQAGAMVGDGTKGVITVSNGRVLENKVGPRQVPTNGFALVYEPDIRELALVDEGNQAAIEVEFADPAFSSSRYAIEAGPLLVQNGQSAYQPDLEQFGQGIRIDSFTQQAAIGVKPDGTVLLVTADNMVIPDLIPLFISLGAQNAMRLDSGASTSLYLEGKVVNRQTPTRRVVTAIIFVPF
jgi:hypothetical protein